MQIPIISGIYRDDGQLQPARPVNLIPTPKDSGISNGYLRPAEGLVQYATGSGNDRAAIVWNGVHYRVSGDKLISVSDAGVVTVIGNVGSGQSATLDYGFDRLVVVSNGNVFYWTGSVFSQITDSDLGFILDGCWIDGYFLFTDGESLITTELNDPLAVNPLKYGSSEADPDSVVAVFRIRTELYAVNRYSIEVFDNVGGELFPFQRIDGAMGNKGAIGTQAVCVFTDNLVFVGGARNESLGAYIAQNSQTMKVSTPDIDALLNAVPVSQWGAIQVETRLDQSHQWIYIHLPDRTVVFDKAGSEALQQPVWFTLCTGVIGFSQYQARNFVWAGNNWACGNPVANQIGKLSSAISHHWGSPVRWEFSTSIIYNKNSGAIFQRLELSVLAGQVEINVDPRISTSYSVDGQTWSMPKSIPAGRIGNTSHRPVWLQQGIMKNWRIQRFQGDSYSHITIVGLDITLEPLAW
jgi:hypothetical protein